MRKIKESGASVRLPDKCVAAAQDGTVAWQRFARRYPAA